jgi:hypothetical protein
VIAKITECDGYFFAAGQTQEGDGCVTKRGEIFRAVPFFDLAFVFARRDIAHPVQPIFDAPVANQKRRIGSIARKTADGALDFDRDAMATTISVSSLPCVNLRGEWLMSSRILAILSNTSALVRMENHFPTLCECPGPAVCCR